MVIVDIAKSILASPAATPLIIVVGLAVGSAMLRRYLLKRGYEVASATADKVVYLAGGAVFLEVFMHVIKATARIFGLY